MSDAKNYPCETRLNIQFGPLETIDKKASLMRAGSYGSTKLFAK